MKTIRDIYKEQTGRDAVIGATDEQHSIAVYVEGPTKHYLEWVEERALAGSPKLPPWEDIYKWAMDSHGTPDLDLGRYAILRGCYDYMCHQLQPGA